MNCDSSLGAVRLILPDTPINLLRSEYFSRMLHQQLQNLIFPRRQIDQLTVHTYLLAPVVQTDRPHPKSFRFLFRSAELQISAQLRTHPGGQLDRIEGFCDIVVRTDVQAQYLICVFALRGQQNDREIFLFPQSGQGTDSVKFGHHNVQQNKSDFIIVPEG